MSSPPANKPAPFSRELIEKEIAHLKNRTSARHAHEVKRTWSKLLITLAGCGLLGLYFMDVVLFSYNRGDAIRVYLYLHNYGNDQKAASVADSGLLTPNEVRRLNLRQGSFQDYFTGTQGADRKADELLAYMQQVDDLHHGHFDELSALNKVRYVLFMKTGLVPPTRWAALNSSIDK